MVCEEQASFPWGKLPQNRILRQLCEPEEGSAGVKIRDK